MMTAAAELCQEIKDYDDFDKDAFDGDVAFSLINTEDDEGETRQSEKTHWKIYTFRSIPKGAVPKPGKKLAGKRLRHMMNPVAQPPNAKKGSIFWTSETVPPEFEAALTKELVAHEKVFEEVSAEVVKAHLAWGRSIIQCRLILATKRCGKRKARFVCLGYQDCVSGAGVDHRRHVSVTDMTTISLQAISCVNGDVRRAY
jgi:hypothetical protein